MYRSEISAGDLSVDEIQAAAGVLEQQRQLALPIKLTFWSSSPQVGQVVQHHVMASARRGKINKTLSVATCATGELSKVISDLLNDKYRKDTR